MYVFLRKREVKHKINQGSKMSKKIHYLRLFLLFLKMPFYISLACNKLRILVFQRFWNQYFQKSLSPINGFKLKSQTFGNLRAKVCDRKCFSLRELEEIFFFLKNQSVIYHFLNLDFGIEKKDWNRSFNNVSVVYMTL